MAIKIAVQLFIRDYPCHGRMRVITKDHVVIKVTFARNLSKKLSPLFYYLILLFQLSVANPENFEEFKVMEVLKIRKEKKGISPTSLVR